MILHKLMKSIFFSKEPIKSVGTRLTSGGAVRPPVGSKCLIKQATWQNSIATSAIVVLYPGYID